LSDVATAALPRGLWNRALELWYGRTGVPRVVNGVRLQVLPRFRWYFAETYDAHVVEALQRAVRPGAICLSVGANLGVYPLQFASWTAPNGRVIAFEPNPTTAAFLRRHVAMNGFADRVEVVETAVSDRRGAATFFAAGTDGMSRLGAPNPLLGDAAREISVETDTLDDFCKRRGLRPDLMMIDVEGFEERVLAGARSLLAGETLPTIVVEMHPDAWGNAGGDARSFKALLDGANLVARPLSGQQDSFADYGHVLLERRPS
jgi:FkbM family methyltransferase